MRALELLAFTPLSAPQLAAVLHAHPRTVRRVLSRLVEDGYLTYNNDGRRVYEPTMRLVALAGQVVENSSFARRARPYVMLLREHSGATAHLVVPAYHQVLCLVHAAGPEHDASPRLRELVPAHCTAGGKALLAWRDRWRESVLDRPLERFTERTLVEPDALRRDLARMRAAGYATEDAEFQPTIRAIAVPVFAGGDAVAALSVSGEGLDMDGTAAHLVRVANELIEDLRRVAARMRAATATTGPPGPDHARAAYDAFADDYDFFTADHDYEDWTATIERLARDHGLAGNRLLDVACGTGKSLMPFARRGYSVTGCDVSEAMVRHARLKAPPGVRLEVHDMRDLPRLGTFDLVCCLDDAVNYLTTADELLATLAGLRRNLAAGGVLVFDVNTVRSYRTFFASLKVSPSEDRVVVWDGHTSKSFSSGALARCTLDVLRRAGDGNWHRRTSVHHQRHHPQDTVERAIEDAGLATAGVYGMHLDGTVTAGFAEGSNSKALYIARHRAAEGARR